MEFAYDIGDEVEIVASGRVIERTETEHGNRYFVQLDNGRKIGVAEEHLAYVLANMAEGDSND